MVQINHGRTLASPHPLWHARETKDPRGLNGRELVMNARYVLCCAVLVVGRAVPVFGDGQPDPPVAGQAIVRLGTNGDIDAFIVQCEAAHAAMNLQMAVADTIEGESTYLIEFDPSEADLTELESYLNNYGSDQVTWGGFAYVAQAPEGGTGSIWFLGPDGPDFFGEQFASGTLGLPAAHLSSTGQGTVVAVLDTGVDEFHPQLQGRVLAGGFNFVDNDGITADAANGVDDDGDGVVDELVGHGTFVASLVTLAAPDALILPIKVLNSDGVGSDWTVASGIQYAIDHGVDVINLSLSSTNPSDAIKEAIERAANLGIVTVSAAGNFGTDDRQYPAVESPVIGVAATDEQDVKASFSSYNEDIAISAPGGNIYLPQGQPDPDYSIIGAMAGGDYVMWEGTSFATALVSGGAALVRAQHPEWPDADVPVDEITDRIEQVLTSTAVDIYSDELNPGFEHEELGEGRMNLAAALAPLGDLDYDGAVGILDYLLLLADWGLTDDSPADLDDNEVVGITDLLILLENWS